jgi:hypothetical protein
MNNCLILGFGRSGTSMMGGLLDRSGYYTGENSYGPRNTNPRGFFEDEKINNVNERILENFDYHHDHPVELITGKTYSPFNPRYGHRWLSFIPHDVLIDNQDPLIHQEIVNIVNKSMPFAFKDPRFSYTLPVWCRILDINARFICLFRNPSATVKSVLFECSSVEYLSDFYIDEMLCYQLWANCYQNIIDNHLPLLKDRLLLVSYEHMVGNGKMERLSEFLGAPISNAFIDPELNRSKAESTCPANIHELYQTLLHLAEK